MQCTAPGRGLATCPAVPPRTCSGASARLFSGRDSPRPDAQRPSTRLEHGGSLMSNAPVASYSLTVRLRILNSPGMLGKVTSAIGAEGGDIGAIDIVDAGREASRDTTFQASAGAPGTP